ncbi:hypothetical protein VNO77_23314 [Canavalia gladiata]|uniref:Uncharacterized protein n=1 Tax=Canavalia gladiata TaxID=3824 RepID=A0AAN9Q8T8_CANGL
MLWFLSDSKSLEIIHESSQKIHISARLPDLRIAHLCISIEVSVMLLHHESKSKEIAFLTKLKHTDPRPNAKPIKVLTREKTRQISIELIKIDECKKTKALGIDVVPVLIGLVPDLLLSKSTNGSLRISIHPGC